MYAPGKISKPTLYLHWWWTVPVDLKEIHFTSPVPPSRKLTYLDLPTFVFQVSNAMYAIAVSPMPGHSNNLSKMRHTTSQICFEALLRFVPEQQSGSSVQICRNS